MVLEHTWQWPHQGAETQRRASEFSTMQNAQPVPGGHRTGARREHQRVGGMLDLYGEEEARWQSYRKTP